MQSVKLLFNCPHNIFSHASYLMSTIRHTHDNKNTDYPDRLKWDRTRQSILGSGLCLLSDLWSKKRETFLKETWYWPETDLGLTWDREINIVSSRLLFIEQTNEWMKICISWAPERARKGKLEPSLETKLYIVHRKVSLSLIHVDVFSFSNFFSSVLFFLANFQDSGICQEPHEGKTDFVLLNRKIKYFRFLQFNSKTGKNLKIVKRTFYLLS